VMKRVLDGEETDYEVADDDGAYSK
jgi:hypothetical protein